MSLKFKNSQEYLNKLQMQINLLIALPMLVLIYFFLRIENGLYTPDILPEETIFYLRVGVLFMVVFLVILGVIGFKKSIESLNPEMHLRDKLELFFAASITRSSLFEAATIISLAGLILSGEQIYVGYYTICLVAFSITYPTLQRINKQLKLKNNEREIILSRKEIE
ncbi:MAG: hypothetical protein KFF73_16515 [Cyclobacteriaceae bacterium]|nr:hypothetical protein [Cyclobacteriaceae bacterium]